MPHETSSSSLNSASASVELRLSRLEREWYGEAGFDGARITLRTLHDDVADVQKRLREQRLLLWVGALSWIAIAVRLWMQQG